MGRAILDTAVTEEGWRMRTVRINMGMEKAMLIRANPALHESFHVRVGRKVQFIEREGEEPRNGVVTFVKEKHSIVYVEA